MPGSHWTFDAGVDELASGADARLERDDVWDAAGPRRHDSVGAGRPGCTSGSDVDHDSGRRVSGASATRGNRRAAALAGAAAAALRNDGASTPIEDEGPADGLTLDQAIEILVRQSIDLRAKYLEIPQMRADVLTASLRANPILYADSQLVPYGTNSVRKPDGPTQYDLNVSHPIDFSHKRRARIAYASRALQVMEAQYQNEVRLAIPNLYAAFVDVLTARAAIRYMKASVKGLDEVVRVSEGHYEKRTGTRPDVDQAKSDREIAVLGVIDAEEMLQKRKRVLGEMLNLSPARRQRRSSFAELLRYEGPQPPPLEELVAIARDSRPDFAAFRHGNQGGHANVRLQRANRFSDAYLLYQPYTFQNNAPFGKESGTSWALGITVPLPLYNRNQGNIERARINVVQTQTQLELLDRRLVTEIQQAIRRISSQRAGSCGGIRENVVPGLKRAYEDRLELFREGEDPKIVFLERSAKIQRCGQDLSRFGGATSPQHARLEYGRRPADHAVKSVEREKKGGSEGWKGQSDHLWRRRSSNGWQDADRQFSMRWACGRSPTLTDAQAIRFLTTWARSVPVSVRL